MEGSFMAVTVEWYNEDKQAFYVRYSPGWTWDEHHKAVREVQDLRAAHQLEMSFCIFDMSGTTIPIGSPVGPHYTDPPHESFIAMVVDNLFARTIIQIAIRALRKNHMFQIVGTREEANELLEARLSEYRTAH
jgi:hypothetical protein